MTPVHRNPNTSPRPYRFSNGTPQPSDAAKPDETVAGRAGRGRGAPVHQRRHTERLRPDAEGMGLTASFAQGSGGWQADSSGAHHPRVEAHEIHPQGDGAQPVPIQKALFMTVIGVAGCTSLLVTASAEGLHQRHRIQTVRQGVHL